MQPAGRYSPLGLVGLALDHGRLLILVPLAALVISVGFSAAVGGRYTATASFAPQARPSDAARLSGLASQLGVSLGGSGDSESIDFYARLATSRALLEQVAQREYRFPKRGEAGDTLQGSLLDLLQVRGSTERERLLAGVRALERMVAVHVDFDASVITLSTAAPWEGLAEQINRALLDEINTFNLERRQSQAAAERRFAEAELVRSQAELEAAEEELSTFLQHNRRYDEWPQLRFEAARLQRRVEHRQQVHTTLAQRLEQARVDEVRNIPVITVIDAPEGSARRHRGLVKAGVLSMIGGFGLAVGLVFVGEYRDRLRAEHPEDYRRLQERTRAAVSGWRKRRLRSALVPLLLPAALLPAACADSLLGPEAQYTFTRIATGAAHSCALTAHGEAWCWGRGAEGELGNGGRFSTAVPVRVISDVPFTEITAGAAHTCALTVDGAAYCWGWNAFFQRGNAFDPVDAIPVRVSGGHSFSAISAGAHHTCAVSVDERALCWGFNRFGQIGNGSTGTAAEPLEVAGGLRFRHIAAGAWHTCAVSTGDVAYCWGSNDQGQLGVGSDVLHAAVPTPVATNVRFNRITAGTNHSCALSGGRAYCWGGNEHGQLGDGGAFQPGLPGASRPVPTAGGLVYEQIAAGTFVTCATTNDRAQCWGRGSFGQLGGGVDGDSYWPRSVQLHARGLLRFTRIATAGSTHACAISAGEAIYCWGTGPDGQLGRERQTFATEPLRVRFPRS